MAEFDFGVHNGHLKAKADRIAKKHGATHTNYTSPSGMKQGWFSIGTGDPQRAKRVEQAIEADIDQEGGLNALRK